MHSDLIGKIEKARHYAQEPERFVLDKLHVRFQGGNHNHILTLQDNAWHCDCGGYQRHGTCAHVIALQKLLQPMLSAQAREEAPIGSHSDAISMIEKSRHYTREPQRVSITMLQGRFHGSNNDHILSFAEGWQCDCTTFRLYQTCAHVMALQKILSAMLPSVALESLSPVGAQQIVGALS